MKGFQKIKNKKFNLFITIIIIVLSYFIFVSPEKLNIFNRSYKYKKFNGKLKNEVYKMCWPEIENLCVKKLQNYTENKVKFCYKGHSKTIMGFCFNRVDSLKLNKSKLDFEVLYAGFNKRRSFKDLKERYSKKRASKSGKKKKVPCQYDIAGLCSGENIKTAADLQKCLYSYRDSLSVLCRRHLGI